MGSGADNNRPPSIYIRDQGKGKTPYKKRGASWELFHIQKSLIKPSVGAFTYVGSLYCRWSIVLTNPVDIRFTVLKLGHNM